MNSKYKHIIFCLQVPADKKKLLLLRTRVKPGKAQKYVNNSTWTKGANLSPCLTEKASLQDDCSPNAYPRKLKAHTLLYDVMRKLPAGSRMGLWLSCFSALGQSWSEACSTFWTSTLIVNVAAIFVQIHAMQIISSIPWTDVKVLLRQEDTLLGIVKAS